MMAHATGLAYLKKEALPLMWCSGCGHGIVLGALLRAFEELEYEHNKVVVVTGIGCWGKADDYIATNALHTTHGRALSYATGVKAANPDLHVVVLMGDGDGATIGGNHLIHSARRNMDITAILVNNLNYGMTGGQYSATTPANSRTSTSKYGNPEKDFDICALVDAAGANYVARETVFNGLALKNYMKEALSKKGFSLVEAIGPCTTLFGPNNKMKQPVDMLKWLKEKSIPVSKYKGLAEEEREGYFAVGKITDRNVPDFGTRYSEIQKKLQG
ncbi:MAG: 2-oxoacid:ferredoxin oxidoreductase, beta subunit [Firmicutes bacterium]|nr:2-oxoacid:ferredoxin oxidoreductase, beta subunit [Bacillota bacterium]